MKNNKNQSKIEKLENKREQYSRELKEAVEKAKKNGINITVKNFLNLNDQSRNTEK